MHFAFKQQDVSLVFEAERGLLSRLKSVQPAPDLHLNVSSLLSQVDAVVLQSPTASTLVEIRELDGSAFSAMMTTRYFGEFVEHEDFERRAAYTRDKTNRLLELLTTAGARLVFCGFVTLARSDVAPKDHDELRRRISERFVGLKTLAEGDALFDFIMRASRRPDERRFSNIQLSWFEERSLTVPVGLRPPTGGGVSIPEWEMPVTNAGLELRFDQNNKNGLRGGRRDWLPEDFRGLVESYLHDLPGAVKTVVSYLGGQNA